MNCNKKKSTIFAMRFTANTVMAEEEMIPLGR